MPSCGATVEKYRPPWTRGDFRGVGVGVRLGHYNPLKASRPLSFRLLSLFGNEDFQGGLNGTRIWDTVL